MQTYTEKVLRFVVERHEELPESHKAEYRLRGIDPDQLWSLIFSFDVKQDAERCCAEQQERAPKFWTYRVRDLGETQYIERSMF